MTAIAPKRGDWTRWGTIDTITILAPNIVFVSTASHGGIWVSPSLEAQIPAALRAVARQYAPEQWYEEDCDACIVGATFGDAIIAHDPRNLSFVQSCRDYMTKDPRMKV